MGLVSVRLKLLIGLTSTTAAMGLTLSTVYASTVQYTVRSGDSLYGIAQKCHTSVSSIESLNHLHSTVIHPGQKLSVNGSSSSSSTSSSSLVSLGSRSGTPDAAMAADLRGYEISQYAKQFIGVPYVWGGTSPSGFDCSGFVQYVYGQCSVGLPRTSYDQYGIGSSVSQANLLPGDIVFFDTFGSGASHDGIYLGNGQFINAASKSVEIDSMSNEYWSSHYIGARRP